MKALQLAEDFEPMNQKRLARLYTKRANKLIAETHVDDPPPLTLRYRMPHDPFRVHLCCAILTFELARKPEEGEAAVYVEVGADNEYCPNCDTRLVAGRCPGCDVRRNPIAAFEDDD